MIYAYKCQNKKPNKRQILDEIIFIKKIEEENAITIKQINKYYKIWKEHKKYNM